ncbi:MAG: sigma-54-dependent Fis family transcriptional regulator [Ignavibacteriaceae bacterium]|nr:sigma-54-dependent Fis family transcriptional regulator [Ignavibacteriaceae bacterium]
MTIEQFQKENGIIAKSREIREIIEVIMQVAPTDISVLIFGESGVGKEVFARAIHNSSHRSSRQLVSVNCGAIPEGILESELFGHKKGSFTGAVDSRKGYFELADKGTLFLDEIAEMPLVTQVKLLRAIELQEFMVLGAETVTKVDVRFIAATNKDLQEQVEKKKFRQDLYFRLKAVTLNIPPLRKRKIDIDVLVDHFMKKICQENNIRIPRMTSEVMDVLLDYPWPGNVRELKNTIESAVTLNRDIFLSKELIMSLLRIQEPAEEKQRNLPMALGKNPQDAQNEFIYRALFELKKDILEIKAILQGYSPKVFVNEEKVLTSGLSVKDAEKNAIIAALTKARGNKRKASRLLDISERTLYRKIKEYEIYDW